MCWLHASLLPADNGITAANRSFDPSLSLLHATHLLLVLVAVQYALYQGFYVQLDYHGNKGGDQSLYDPEYFITSWKKLLTCVDCHWDVHILTHVGHADVNAWRPLGVCVKSPCLTIGNKLSLQRRAEAEGRQGQDPDRPGQRARRLRLVKEKPSLQCL